MKSFPLLIICLLATTCFSSEEVDPELLPLTFGKLPSDDFWSAGPDQDAVFADVEYECSRAAEVERCATKNGFYVYDRHPVRKGVRVAQAVSSKFHQHAFEKFLSQSGLFLNNVGTPRGPGFFYVFVEARQKGEAIHYFQV